MTLYEVQVFDDGECAVRKTPQRSSYETNVLFDSPGKLIEYLESFLCIRWPITEVLDAIEAAKEYEWIEFK